MSRLIFGCGYLGRRVARQWRDTDENIFVVTRSARRAHAFKSEGYTPIVADVVRPETLANLPVVDAVLYAVGHDRGSDASLRDVYVDGLAAVLEALPAETGKLIYISTTGVYGQSDGEWVDEDSPCDPSREAGRAFLEAEQMLSAHQLGERAVILRLAGMYGPKRIPNAAEIRNREAITAAEESFLNLIHVDDAVEVVLAAERQAKLPALYVVSDGHPAERRLYYQELARLLKAPPPRFEPATADAPAGARSGSNKQVKNARMLKELGVKLAYPSYRQGLSAIVAADSTDVPGDG